MNILLLILFPLALGGEDSSQVSSSGISSSGCTADSDCTNGHCESGGCASYAQTGESCGGTMPPIGVCAPGLDCIVPYNTDAMNLPGRCGRGCRTNSDCSSSQHCDIPSKNCLIYLHDGATCEADSTSICGPGLKCLSGVCTKDYSGTSSSSDYSSGTYGSPSESLASGVSSPSEATTGTGYPSSPTTTGPGYASSPAPTGPGYASSPAATGPGYASSPAATGPGYASSPAATGPGYASSPVPTGPGYSAPPTAPGYASSPVATGPGYASSPVATGPGYASSPAATGPGYASSPVTTGPGYASSPAPTGPGYASSPPAGPGYASSPVATGPGYASSPAATGPGYASSPASTAPGYPGYKPGHSKHKKGCGGFVISHGGKTGQTGPDGAPGAGTNCAADSDCTAGKKFCDPTTSTCMAYRELGESCGNAGTLTSLQCAPGLRCLAQQPMPGAPRICINDDNVTCPPRLPAVSCFTDPCNISACEGYPNATCVADYCGGCNTKWSEGGQAVQCKTPDCSAALPCPKVDAACNTTMVPFGKCCPVCADCQKIFCPAIFCDNPVQKPGACCPLCPSNPGIPIPPPKGGGGGGGGDQSPINP